MIFGSLQKFAEELNDDWKYFYQVCIQSWNGLARLVLAHVIAANFLMWFKITLKETLESIVVNVPRHYHNIRMFCERNYANSFTDMEEVNKFSAIFVRRQVMYTVIYLSSESWAVHVTRLQDTDSVIFCILWFEIMVLLFLGCKQINALF